MLFTEPSLVLFRTNFHSPKVSFSCLQSHLLFFQNWFWLSQILCYLQSHLLFFSELIFTLPKFLLVAYRAISCSFRTDFDSPKVSVSCLQSHLLFFHNWFWLSQILCYLQSHLLLLYLIFVHCYDFLYSLSKISERESQISYFFFFNLFDSPIKIGESIYIWRVK